jgi:uncharacterized protein Usg
MRSMVAIGLHCAQIAHRMYEIEDIITQEVATHSEDLQFPHMTMMVRFWQRVGEHIGSSSAIYARVAR